MISPLFQGGNNYCVAYGLAESLIATAVSSEKNNRRADKCAWFGDRSVYQLKGNVLGWGRGVTALPQRWTPGIVSHVQSP